MAYDQTDWVHPSPFNAYVGTRISLTRIDFELPIQMEVSHSADSDPQWSNGVDDVFEITIADGETQYFRTHIPYFDTGTDSFNLLGIYIDGVHHSEVANLVVAKTSAEDGHFTLAASGGAVSGFVSVQYIPVEETATDVWEPHYGSRNADFVSYSSIIRVYPINGDETTRVGTLDDYIVQARSAVNAMEYALEIPQSVWIGGSLNAFYSGAANIIYDVTPIILEHLTELYSCLNMVREAIDSQSADLISTIVPLLPSSTDCYMVQYIEALLSDINDTETILDSI